jgi:iron complex transport system substrate-binding protein
MMARYGSALPTISISREIIYSGVKMKNRIIALLILLTCVLSIMPGCGNSARMEASVTETVQFTDSSGRLVKVPKNITRIAASGSLAQIMLFAIAPGELVGLANQWSDAAAQFIDSKYQDLPVLGQFYGSGDLNMEEIAKVNPQVIIDLGEAKSTIVADMDNISKQVNIPAVHIDANISNMADAYRTLGKLLGLEDKAEVLAKYCEEVYGETKAIIQKVGEQGKVSLVYCMGDDGLNIIAKGSYHAEVIDLLSDNLAAVNSPTSKGTGNAVDMEQLLKWDPDVIIFAPDSVYDTAAGDQTWRRLKAIASGKYYEVPRYPYNWMGFPPSVNRYMGMIWLTQLLYPDAARYDLYPEAARYYDLFYHCNLTKDQYDRLVANSTGKK